MTDKLKEADDYEEPAAQRAAGTQVNRTYEVPWLANRSINGDVVYIDKRIPEWVQGIDTSVSLALHELGEWEAMNDGYSYDWAHENVGQVIEQRYVERQGVSWQKYQDEMMAFMREVDDDDIEDVPPDIDLRPFEDEHEHTVMQALSRHTAETRKVI